MKSLKLSNKFSVFIKLIKLIGLNSYLSTFTLSNLPISRATYNIYLNIKG